MDIENEYLKCTVLPELGGRIYSCIDKIKRHDLFFAGAAGGEKFDFPVSPSPTSALPADFAVRENADGSGSIFVGNTSRVNGLRWLAEVTLRPGSGVVEQRVRLSNPGSSRRGYSWRNEATVAAYDDTQVYLGCYLTAESPSGGKFAFRSHEPFMGVYSVHEGAGTAHYASVGDVPGKWVRSGESEDGAPYVRLAAGLFPNLGDRDFLEPRESRAFTEYWMPLRGLGGLSRVNPEGAVYLRRLSGGAIAFALNVYRNIPKARIRVFEGDRVLLEEALSLTPEATLTRSIPDPRPTSKAHFELLDEKGNVLLAHTEDYYDALKGTPPPTPAVGEPDKGKQAELDGNLLAASKAYQNQGLALAAGRVAVMLNRFEEAAEELAAAGPYPEVRLYLGVAYSYLGNEPKARAQWTAAPQDHLFGIPARLELACLLSRTGDRPAALRQVAEALKLRQDLAGAGEIEVPLLRSQNQTQEAAQRLAHWLTLDPADSLLRYERVKAGGSDDELWAHFAADSERVLDVATVYMRVGLFPDALELLAHKYPGQGNALISYYRGYCRVKAGGSGREDFVLASKQSPAYVFPSRPETFAVLRAALKDNPADAFAHYLLGSLYLEGGMTDRAAREWRDALKNHGEFPGLQAGLGRLEHEFKNYSIRPKVVRPTMANGATVPANTPHDPEGWAALVLERLQAGHIADAANVFTETNFPKEKQSQFVREAFIEARLQAILDLAQGRHCQNVLRAADGIGEETQGVPFSMYSFGSILKSARIQYLLGTAQSMCGDEKAARKSFNRAAKTADRAGAMDAAFAALAEKKLSGGGNAGVAAALDRLKDAGTPEQIYAQGILERELGQATEAETSLQKASDASGGNGMLKYFCRMALAGKF